MSFVDKELTCVACGRTFVFSAGEQAFFQHKEFTHEPRRCKECRASHLSSQRRAIVETQVKDTQRGTDTTVPFKPRRAELSLSDARFPSRRKVIPFAVGLTRKERFDAR